MRNYKAEMKIVRWTFWRVLGFVIIAIIVLGGVVFALNSFGLLGRTVVEREVFERSYQRQASLKSRIATDKALLAEIEQKLRNPKLDEETRHNLKAQAAAARIRIQSAEEQLR